LDERLRKPLVPIDGNRLPKAAAMSIEADDVRRLLSAGDRGAVMVLIAGQIKIIAAEEIESPAYRGALQVVSREQLISQNGTADLSDHELAEQAESLDVAVRNLGG
jgi:hypothetical protein